MDGLSSLSQLLSWPESLIRGLQDKANAKLIELVSGRNFPTSDLAIHVSSTASHFQIGCFAIPMGSHNHHADMFSFEAPTSLANAFRLMRACQIEKPILIEGSPGVGKTSLVTALARAAKQKLCRINLSEQTDLVDLFGSDLPSSGVDGSFVWNDADFLRALKEGHWVLLDEMNLASQSILEGLNAVFDHRGTVYIPELDRSFIRHPNFRVFAAQNPLSQGSGRKGLPKSFMNRFTKVYVNQLQNADLLFICQHLFPSIPSETLRLMIEFNSSLHEEVVVKKRWGLAGSPWEFNLRDILKWASLMVISDGALDEPWKHFGTVYLSRFRNDKDKVATLDLFRTVFSDDDVERKLCIGSFATPFSASFGGEHVEKGAFLGHAYICHPLPSHNQQFEAALASIKKEWLVIVTGCRSVGKSSFVRTLSYVSGRPFRELSLSTASDTSDLVGSYEQTDDTFHRRHLLDVINSIVSDLARNYGVSLAGPVVAMLKAVDSMTKSSEVAEIDLARTILEAMPENHRNDSKVRELERVIQKSEKGVSLCPKFEWIDGPLTEAMRDGGWLVLDNASLCSPSVLDRLNSVCETDGLLVLNEKGEGQDIIRPHAEFRLIMTVDSQHGEISRAMRNRGVEIALTRPSDASDIPYLTAAKRLPLTHPLQVGPEEFSLLKRSVSTLLGVSNSSGLPTPCILMAYDDSISMHAARMMELLPGAIEDGPAATLTILEYSALGHLPYLRRVLSASKSSSSRATFVFKLLDDLLSVRDSLQKSALCFAVQRAPRFLVSMELSSNVSADDTFSAADTTFLRHPI